MEKINKIIEESIRGATDSLHLIGLDYSDPINADIKLVTQFSKDTIQMRDVSNIMIELYLQIIDRGLIKIPINIDNSRIGETREYPKVSFKHLEKRLIGVRDNGRDDDYLNACINLGECVRTNNIFYIQYDGKNRDIFIDRELFDDEEEYYIEFAYDSSEIDDFQDALNNIEVFETIVEY